MPQFARAFASLALLCVPLAAAPACGGAAIPAEGAAPPPVPATEIAVAPPPREAPAAEEEPAAGAGEATAETAEKSPAQRVAEITAELDQLDIQMLGALSGGGSTLQIGGTVTGVLQIGQGGSGGLAALGQAGVPGPATGAAGPAGPAAPKGDAQVQIASRSGGKVANADAVVAGMRAGFRRCYVRGLTQDPAMRGSLQIRATLGPNGEVTAARPESQKGISPEVAACATARVSAAQFAPPEGASAEIVIRLSLEPAKGP